MKLFRRGGAPTSRRADREPIPRILILDPDPYLTFLIQLDLPKAEVIEADPSSDPQALIATNPDLVLADLANRRASHFLNNRGDIKAVGIVEGARASRTAVPKDLDGVLFRPFVPAELHRAIRHALGLARADKLPESNRLRRLHSWLAPARMGAIAMTAVLEVAGGELRDDPVRVLLIAGAFLFVSARFLGRTVSQLGAALDVFVAAMILSYTGGQASNYLPFGLVASFEAGLVFRLSTGWIAGALVAMGSFAEIFYAVQGRSMPPREVVAWSLLFPFTALAAGLAARTLGRGGSEEMLAEANRILSTLHRIARAMPGRLEVGGVASDALREAQETLDSSAGAVLIGEAGMVAPIAAFGITRTDELILRQDDPFLTRVVEGGVKVLKLHQMPPGIQGVFSEHECWLAAPLQHGGVASGLIMVGCPDESHHDSNKLLLRQIAREASVALENARLFGQVRELSVDEERRRLARELHDGIAQALAHIRLELEFMARHGVSDVDTARSEAERLARVVERAGADVRSMINGLTSMVSGEGLAVSLNAYLRDLKGLGGPSISFESRGVARLSPEVEAEVFRIAQESVSNAIRHSKAAKVNISLFASESSLTLTVADDGVGLASATPEGRDGRGLGLQAMRERANRVGGTLEVEGEAGAGTRVKLHIDLAKNQAAEELQA